MKNKLWFCWDLYLSTILSCMVSPVLASKGNCQAIFQSGCTILHSQQQCMGDSVPPHPYWNLMLSLNVNVIVFFCHSDRCVLICHCTFNPPMVNDFEHLFLCLSAICISSSMKCLCISFTCFLIGFCLYCWVLRVCYVLQIVVLCWIHGCKYYLSLCNIYFCPFSRVFL